MNSLSMMVALNRLGYSSSRDRQSSSTGPVPVFLLLFCILQANATAQPQASAITVNEVREFLLLAQAQASAAQSRTRSWSGIVHYSQSTRSLPTEGIIEFTINNDCVLAEYDGSILYLPPGAANGAVPTTQNSTIAMRQTPDGFLEYQPAMSWAALNASSADLGGTSQLDIVKRYGVDSLGTHINHQVLIDLIDTGKRRPISLDEETTPGLWRLILRGENPDIDSETRVSILIDKHRDGALVEGQSAATNRSTGKTWATWNCSVELQQIGGEWMPRTVKEFRSSEGQGEQAIKIEFIDLRLVSFGDPCSSSSLVLPAGTNLSDNINGDLFKLTEPTTMEDVLDGKRTSMAQLEDERDRQESARSLRKLPGSLYGPLLATAGLALGALALLLVAIRNFRRQ
jgi:hypothetical protein